jgi:DNA-directed RNA polymerase subunit M/transcription elongation factor TFIIS
VETAFVKIVQQIVSDRGKNVVTNTAVFNSLLADYACGKFIRERRLFIQELKTKSYDEAIQKYLSHPPKPVRPPVPSPHSPSPAVPPQTRSQNNTDADDEYIDDDYDEDSDENEYDSRGEKTPDSTGEDSGFTVKCPKCGTEYSVTDKRALRCFDQGFICDRCGASWKVSFFGTCAHCKENVGFDNWSWGNSLAYLGTSFLTAFNRKDSIFTTLGDIANSMIPESDAVGVCPICRQEHAACPKCGGASPFSSVKQARGKTLRCRHCGQKMNL